MTVYEYAIIVAMIVFSSLVVIYITIQHNKAMMHKIARLERKLDDICTEVRYLRRKM